MGASIVLFPLVCFWAVRLEAIPTSGQDDAAKRETFLLASSTPELQKKLDTAAAQGYRVLLTSHEGAGLLAWLERATRPPDLYQYKVLKTVRLKTMENEINEAAKQGFRLMPGASMLGFELRGSLGGNPKVISSDDFVAVLERPPRPKNNFEYRLALARSQSQRSKIQAEGYAPYALTGDAAFFEKEADAALSAPSGGGTGSYLMLQTLRLATMQKELDQAASQGFRVMAASSSVSDLFVWLKRTAQPSETYEYRILPMFYAVTPGYLTEKKDEKTALYAKTIQETLPELGRQGFRILHGGLLPKAAVFKDFNEGIVLLERAPKEGRHFEFQLCAVTEDNVESLSSAVSKLTAEGHSPVGLYHSGRGLIVVVEKERAPF